MIDTHDLKKMLRMFFIYHALESGWTVTKMTGDNKFEFTKSPTHIKSKNKIFKSPRRCISDPIRYNMNI